MANPSIEDTGRDGHPFAHIDFASDAGAWADVLPYCLNITILPDMAFQSPLDAVEGRPDADPATDVSAPFHADPNAETNRDNPHGR